MGLWSIEGRDEGFVYNEARRYFHQYYNDGEYAELLSNVARQPVAPSRLDERAGSHLAYSDELFCRLIEKINAPFKARSGHIEIALEDAIGIAQFLTASRSNIKDGERFDFIERQSSGSGGWVLTMHDGTRLKYGPSTIRQCVDTAMRDYSERMKT